MDESPVVVNVEEAQEIDRRQGQWGGAYKILTPSMRPRGGGLGVNQMRVPPGCASLPFHYHAHEDEVYYILSGRGILRYGEQLLPLRSGDCVACPAGTQTAHQIANPYDEELRYLAVGNHHPDEVCVYPDSGKVMVRSIGEIGFLKSTEYMDGEPEVPAVFAQIDAAADLP